MIYSRKVLLGSSSMKLSATAFYVWVSIPITATNIVALHMLTLSFDQISYIFVKKDAYGLISLWSYILLQLYFYVCLYLKLKPLPKYDWLHEYKNLVFHSLIVPLNLLTCGGFWVLYLHNRNYILPPVVDVILPSWANHVVHTLPPVAILVEMFFSHTDFECKTCYSKPSRRKSFIILNIVLIVYVVLLLQIYFTEGRWVYFAMKHLTPWQNASLIMAAYIVCLFGHFIGYGLQDIIAKQRHGKMVNKME